MRIGGLIAAVCIVSHGCGSVPIVEQVPVPDVAPLQPRSSPPVVILDRVVFDIPKDTVIGEARRGLACVGPEKLIWRADTPRTLREGSYHAEFERVVTGLGYRVPERPQSLFAQPVVAGNALVLAARISKVTENRCSAVAVALFHREQPSQKGNVRLFIQWEVFSLAEKRVVLALDTEGSAIEPDFKPVDEQDYYRRAFGNALRVLFSRQEYRRLISLR